MHMTDKIITLITGANQGVGFEAAKILLRHSPSYHILLGSRDPTKGTAAVKILRSLPDIKGTVEQLTIDVTSDASVDSAAASVSASHRRLDVLVNNAGILRWGIPGPTREDAREIFETNVVGYISVTQAFMPLLRRSASPRLVFDSSSTGSLTYASDPCSRYYHAAATEYRAGNAARNMSMVMYGVGLRFAGFEVFEADPGLTATNFAGNDPGALRKTGAVELEVSGERIACVVRCDRDADEGRVCGEYGVSPW